MTSPLAVQERAAPTVRPGAALRHSDLAPLSVVVLLGMGVRLFGLTDHGIWFDEAYHVQLVRLPTVGAMLDAVLSNPPSDPLYVLLLRGWTRLFGYEDAAVRSLSVLLSAATLPAAYWLGRVLVGRRAGLLGALLLALSPYALEFGQQAALYALASLTTTLALAAGWRWRATGRGGLLYLALGIVAIYSHYVVAAILGLFALLALHRYAGPRPVATRKWLLAHAAILLAWTPWMVALVLNWLASANPRTGRRVAASAEEVAGALIQFTSGSSALHQHALFPAAAGLLAGGALLAAGWAAGQSPRRSLRLLLLVSAVIFFLPAIVSRLTEQWLFVSHFMLFLLPALFVILAAGYFYLAAASRPWRYIGAALLALWLVAQVWGLSLFYRYPPHGADRLRDLAAILRAEARPGDTVLATPPSLMATLRQYYQGEVSGLPADFDLKAVYRPYEPQQWNAESLSKLERTVAGRERFWLVYRPELDAGGEFLSAVRSRYRQVRERSYPYARLLLFTRAGENP